MTGLLNFQLWDLIISHVRYINRVVLQNYNFSEVPARFIVSDIISSTNFNVHFNINMYVTLLSSTCFGT